MIRTKWSSVSRSMARVAAAFVASALAIALVAGCTADVGRPRSGDAATESPNPAYPLALTDDAGRDVRIAARPERIVSLAPANTEILYALGVGDRVVGVTTYDDYPPEVEGVAKVGDFAGPNLEAVAAAEPDVVFTATGVQADVIKQLEELGATVVAIDPRTLEGVYERIGTVASVVGAPDAGDELVAKMREDARAVADAVEGREPVTAFIEVGYNPLFTAGVSTLLGELITVAGGENVVKEQDYVSYSLEQLVKDDPAVYFATKGSATDAATLSKRPGYAGLAAVKDGRVVILDDNLVSRPGPRIVAGLRLIAEGLHPEAFSE